MSDHFSNFTQKKSPFSHNSSSLGSYSGSRPIQHSHRRSASISNELDLQLRPEDKTSPTSTCPKVTFNVPRARFNSHPSSAPKSEIPIIDLDLASFPRSYSWAPAGPVFAPIKESSIIEEEEEDEDTDTDTDSIMRDASSISDASVLSSSNYTVSSPCTVYSLNVGEPGPSVDLSKWNSKSFLNSSTLSNNHNNKETYTTPRSNSVPLNIFLADEINQPPVKTNIIDDQSQSNRNLKRNSITVVNVKIRAWLSKHIK